MFRISSISNLKHLGGMLTGTKYFVRILELGPFVYICWGKNVRDLRNSYYPAFIIQRVCDPDYKTSFSQKKYV